MTIPNIHQIIKDKKKQDFLIYGIGQAFNLLSPLIVAPYIISICNEAGFGKVGLGFALALFLILIVDYAFEVKGTKEVAQNRHDQKQLQLILNRTLFTKIFLFAVAMSIAVLLITTVPFFAREKMLFYFSMAIVFAQVFNPIWFLQGIEKFALGSAINIGSKSIYVILVFVFVKLESDYVFVNLFLGLSALFFNISGLIIIKARYNFKVIFPGISVIKIILKNDLSFCFSQLSLSVRQLSPLVLTGFFLGYQMAGLYKIIEQIITFFRTFVQVFLKFFYPRLCYKMLNNVGDGFKFWKKYTAINIFIVSILLSVFFVLSEEILLFFNVSPSSLDSLNILFRISMAIPLLMSLSLPLEQLMFTINKNQVYIRIVVLVTVINVSLIFLLISDLQILGVILSLIVAEIMFIIFYFHHTFRIMNDRSNSID